MNPVYDDDTLDQCATAIQDAFKRIDAAKRRYNLAFNDNPMYSREVFTARFAFDTEVAAYLEMVKGFENDGMIPRTP